MEALPQEEGFGSFSPAKGGEKPWGVLWHHFCIFM